MLQSCTTAVLAHALDPAIPWVWVVRHAPKRELGWWRAPMPLSASGRAHDVTVRSVEFDLLLPTSRFLELLPEFLDHGITLFQMSRPVPETLSLMRLPDEVIDRVLVQNGLHLGFHLPHAVETAQFRAPQRETLERLLTIPEIAALALTEIE